MNLNRVTKDFLEMDALSVEDREANSKFMETIMASENAISGLTNECTDMVMNVQAANDMREINRREEEHRLWEARNLFLEEEAEKAQQRVDFINSKWESIAKLNDSIDIHHAYESQKNHYCELIRQKDEVIRALQKELDEMDQKFAHDQNLHREDIKILTRRIDEHVDIMRKTYRKHLKLIENTAIEEQRSSLRFKQAEWERKNNIFEQEKVEDIKEVFKLVETFEKETMDIVWDESENFRSAKRDLEAQLQALEIKVKETKAYCKLEERKLEYNYLVLSKRQEEVGQIKARQKRRINRLHDELTNAENERTELQDNHQRKCVHLETEIAKLNADKDAIIKKMKRTEEVNENIFHQIWRLNEKKIRSILDAIIITDQEITERVLRLEWSAPIFKLETISQLPSIQLYTERIPNFQPQNLDFSQKLESASIMSNSQSARDFNIFKFILSNIIECMKFVLEDKFDHLTEDLDEEETTLIKFDNTLKILDIASESELQSLKKYFLSHIECLSCAASKNKTTLPSITHSRRESVSKLTHRSNSGGLRRKFTTLVERPFSTPNPSGHHRTSSSPQVFCNNSEHIWTINQCEVIKILANFLEDKKQRKNNDSKFIKIPIARVLSPSDIELYWRSFKPAYVDEVKKLWGVLYDPLNNYLQLLKDGDIIENEIRTLEKQNLDLRRALRSFLKKADETS